MNVRVLEYLRALDRFGSFHRATSMATLLQMIHIGSGVSLIPKSVARCSPSIHYIPVFPDPPCRTIGLFWRKTSPRRELMLELADDLTRLGGPVETTEV